MASQLLTLSNVFPNGTSVSAYLAREQVDSGQAPLGTAVNTQTVSSGTVTFTGLTLGESYEAIGQVAGVWTRRAFAVDDYPHEPVYTDEDTTFTGDVDFDGTVTLPAGAKGNLLAGTAGLTFGELAVGANGYEIKADSSQTTGLKWLAPEVFNVKAPPYNATGDGTTDDFAALQAAVDAAFTAGGGLVIVPKGTFMCSGSLLVKAGVTLSGVDRSSSIIKSTAGAAAAAVVRLYGDNDSTVENLTVDTNSRASSGSVQSATASSATVAARHTVRNCRLINTANIACRVSYAIDGFRFIDNIVEDCTGGLSLLPSVATQSYDIRIEGNRFRRVSGVSIQAYAGTAQGTYRFNDVVISGNDLRDFTTPTTAIPIEPTGCVGLVISDNVIGSAATRGVSMGNNTDVTASGNVIIGQTMYAFESLGGKRYTITGNTVKDCMCFIEETNAVLEDVLIEGNTFSGTPASSTQTNKWVFMFANTANVRIKIIGNIVKDFQYLTGVARFGAATTVVSDVSFLDNTIICADVNTPLRGVALAAVSRCVVRGNLFRVTRNLVAGDDYFNPIEIPPSASSDKVTIESNDIIFTGTTAAAANSAGIGSGNVGAAALTGVNVLRNRIVGAERGLRLRINSADLLVADNDTRTCANADDPAKAPTTASAATVTLPVGPSTHIISGTTTITSITAAAPGKRVVLIFTGILTLTDGSNLKLGANFVTSADDAIPLVCDGTNWYAEGPGSAN